MSEAGKGYGILIVVGLIVLVVVVSRMTDICYAGFRRIRNHFAQIRSVRARVVRRKCNRLDLSLRSAGEPVIDMSNDVRDCIITFEISGRLADYGVPAHVYVSACEGAEGSLTLKGDEVLRFVPYVS